MPAVKYWYDSVAVGEVKLAHSHSDHDSLTINSLPSCSTSTITVHDVTEPLDVRVMHDNHT